MNRGYYYERFLNGFVAKKFEFINSLDDAAEILKYSQRNCTTIGLKQEYSFEEMDHLEAFTSRFARLSDIVIQKMFRIIDKIDLEDEGTVRDRINNAEKKGLIDNGETFGQIRIVRNDITHEYHSENLKEIFRMALDLTPHLLSCVNNIKIYCKKYF
jgi:uncharacterized protein YutE (UPF0331/DUF86 family)